MRPDRIVFVFEIDALAPTLDETQRQLEDLRFRLRQGFETAKVPTLAVRSLGAQLRPADAA